ncbi:hypothetical protein BAY1663_03154 [Pseudomonas sp. BAY1663]|uniref:hypothetical protein n=1 Tax=Pseudomonas sp. BAY1663 TaxID=1439940 RepID=UPI00042E10FF|nr:hypothetical protein [Pseudomonas sp. BAY1663]EXF44393.1 hypothetical protein BAY1663_03154 [Pseudomonas sp. BAY1663]
MTDKTSLAAGTFAGARARLQVHPAPAPFGRRVENAQSAFPPFHSMCGTKTAAACRTGLSAFRYAWQAAGPGFPSLTAL